MCKIVSASRSDWAMQEPGSEVHVTSRGGRRSKAEDIAGMLDMHGTHCVPLYSVH
jgi:hypothetical protein